MSYNITLLEDCDILAKNREIYCRPLIFNGGYDNEYHERSYLSGSPVNNFKWAPVEEVLGDCWLDGTKTVGQIIDILNKEMEFVMGQLPKYHIIDPKGN